jgi:hypothetical protein
MTTTAMSSTAESSSASGERSTKRRARFHRLAAPLIAIGIALGLPLVSAAAASASTLPHDGTDPIATGCANTAITVATASVTLTNGSRGTLSLRWSTACKTNWAQFSGGSGVGSVSVWVYRQADSKWCGDQSGNGCNSQWWPNSAYSNQLYGCNYNTFAEVELANNGHPFWVRTAYVGGC